MEQKQVSHGEIQFKDRQRPSINGFLGLAIHLIVIPVIFLLGIALYTVGTAGVILGILFHLAVGLLWFIMWNSYVIMLEL